MKITFLGTAHGVPLKDRFCSSTMIESGGAIYVIDAGAPVADLLLRHGKEITDIRAIFTTHAHSDHTFGLIHLVNLMSWYYRSSSADIYVSNPLQIEAFITCMRANGDLNYTLPDRLRFHVTDPEAPYEDENIRLTYFKNGHMPNSYSILVTEKSSGKRILFSGDFSGNLVLRDVPEILAREEIDLFLCEMAHFGVAELAPYLETCKARSVYFNHVFPLSKYDDIAALKGKYPFEIVCPSDGDSVKL